MGVRPVTDLVALVSSREALVSYGLTLLVFGFLPGSVLRLIVLLYPRDDPRRRELIGELYAMKRISRPIWVVEQIETALGEGLPKRVRAITGIENTEDTGAGDEKSFPAGSLDAEAVRRVAGAEIAVIATADVRGERDVAVLSGGACFLRALDATHLAYPDAGLDPVTASRSNITESPGVALLLVASDGRGGRRGLHLNGQATVVLHDELRARHADLPVNPVSGHPTDVWVVVEVGDAYPLDGDDVPPLGPARSAAAPRGGPGRHRRRRASRRLILS